MTQPGPETWLAARLAAGRPAETWKAVPGWEATHEVSDQGRVRTVKGRTLKQRPNNRPQDAPPELRYPLADLCANGRKVTVTAHSIELRAFAGPCPPGHESRHLDDIPSHNWWPENLAWGTPDQNAADKARQARWHSPEAKARRSEHARQSRATQLAARQAPPVGHPPSRRRIWRWLRRVAGNRT
jgi:NUMOD4 motif/HNH endonuclease